MARSRRRRPAFAHRAVSARLFPTVHPDRLQEGSVGACWRADRDPHRVKAHRAGRLGLVKNSTQPTFRCSPLSLASAGGRPAPSRCFHRRRRTGRRHRNEPRHGCSGRHLEPLQDFSCLRIDQSLRLFGVHLECAFCKARSVPACGPLRGYRRVRICNFFQTCSANSSGIPGDMRR